MAAPLRFVQVAENPGLLFDRIADEYRRVRPGYPDELVDAACAAGGLRRGARVVEVGCGPGTLTQALVARGLSVDAVDPGRHLVDLARRTVGPAAVVRFHVGRFEDVELPERAFDALFSASAFHWVAPPVGWAKAASVLRPGGVLALLNHVDTADELQHRLAEVWRGVYPEAASWGLYDAQALRDGAEARRGNVSEVWAWLTQRDLARPEAAPLFDDVAIHWTTVERETTAEDAIALTRTTSVYLALDPDRRHRLERGIRSVFDSVGGRHRWTPSTVLVTARARG